MVDVPFSFISVYLEISKLSCFNFSTLQDGKSRVLNLLLVTLVFLNPKVEDSSLKHGGLDSSRYCESDAHGLAKMLIASTFHPPERLKKPHYSVSSFSQSELL